MPSSSFKLLARATSTTVWQTEREVANRTVRKTRRKSRSRVGERFRRKRESLSMRPRPEFGPRSTAGTMGTSGHLSRNHAGQFESGVGTHCLQREFHIRQYYQQYSRTSSLLRRVLVVRTPAESWAEPGRRTSLCATFNLRLSKARDGNQPRINRGKKETTVIANVVFDHRNDGLRRWRGLSCSTLVCLNVFNDRNQMRTLPLPRISAAGR